MMKLKPGVTLKISYDGSNHYVQVIKVECESEILKAQLLAGRTVNMLKEPAGNWRSAQPDTLIAAGLLEQIGKALDKLSV